MSEYRNKLIEVAKNLRSTLDDDYLAGLHNAELSKLIVTIAKELNEHETMSFIRPKGVPDDK